jgi:hypothetical protein
MKRALVVAFGVSGALVSGAACLQFSGIDEFYVVDGGPIIDPDATPEDAGDASSEGVDVKVRDTMGVPAD